MGRTGSSVACLVTATSTFMSCPRTSTAAFSSLAVEPYSPPDWAKNRLTNPPEHGRLSLANLPTPLYPLRAFESSSSLLKKFQEWDITLWIKRDDSTGGVELGGNKIRKLEFLLADALARDFTSVVTIGGEQSNHCRATAAAARQVGLEPHLILRTRQPNEDLGFTGNLLVDRMVGSTLYTCTPGEYGRVGSVQLVGRLCEHLQSTTSQVPYPIPVGGSNALGTWGYIEAVDELLGQWKNLQAPVEDSSTRPSLDHVVFACGSGGTATGIAVGLALAHRHNHAFTNKAPPQVHAVGVCDDPDYFYKYVAGIANDMGLQVPDPFPTTEAFCRSILTVHQGKGLGYAVSRPEELEFVSQFARETGVVLDPVYSGKALYHFVKNVVEPNPEAFRGSNVLMWHTGGALGLYDKGHDLLDTFREVAPVHRLDVYGKGDIGIDISKPSE